MGFYVNPPSGSKLRWLDSHGTMVAEPVPFEKRPEGTLLVVLVDNGLFDAAGVAFSAREQAMMTDRVVDRRERVYFYVPVEHLIAVGALPQNFKVSP